MNLRERMLAVPLEQRLAYDEEHNILFLNFERLSVKTSADVKAIHAEIERRLNAIGHKVYGIVNYDHFDLDPQVEDEYAAMVKSLVENYYFGVSRYTTSGFLRAKLGKALDGRGVAPHIYESATEALAHVRDAGSAAKADWLAGRGAGAGTEGPLHDHHVDPPVELAPDRLHHAGVIEAAAAVHADRSGILRVSDHRQHLPQSERRAAFDQRIQQALADAASHGVRRDVDRVFDRVSIGCARTEVIRVGIPEDSFRRLGDEVRKAVAGDVRVPPLHFLAAWRHCLEGAEPVQHVVRVDRLHAGDVVWGGVTDLHRVPQKKKGRHGSRRPPLGVTGLLQRHFDAPRFPGIAITRRQCGLA